jgi:hypothetical protein
VLSDWGKFRILSENFKKERLFLEKNLKIVVLLEDVELVGEFLQCLKILGVNCETSGKSPQKIFKNSENVYCSENSRQKMVKNFTEKSCDIIKIATNFLVRRELNCGKNGSFFEKEENFYQNYHAAFCALAGLVETTLQTSGEDGREKVFPPYLQLWLDHWVNEGLKYDLPKYTQNEFGFHQNPTQNECSISRGVSNTSTFYCDSPFLEVISLVGSVDSEKLHSKRVEKMNCSCCSLAGMFVSGYGAKTTLETSEVFEKFELKKCKDCELFVHKSCFFKFFGNTTCHSNNEICCYLCQEKERVEILNKYDRKTTLETGGEDVVLLSNSTCLCCGYTQNECKFFLLPIFLNRSLFVCFLCIFSNFLKIAVNGVLIEPDFLKILIERRELERLKFKYV